MKITYKKIIISLGFIASFFFAYSVFAYQEQPIFNTGKAWSSASTKGLIWTNWDGLSSEKVEKITLALANGDGGVTWKLYCANRALNQFRSSNYITITGADFYTFTFEDNFAENDLYYCFLSCKSGTSSCGYSNYAWHLDMFGADYNANTQVQQYGGDPSPVVDYYFELYTTADAIIPFEITSHDNDTPAINDTWITVTGTCPIVGENRIGFTNDCLGFPDIQYNVSCVDNEFSGQFFHEATNHRLIARDISSVSGDCVDYDDLMDYITLSPLEIIEGYPDDWYFNFDYYDDYDIRIKSPTFDTALTLPAGSTSASFTFGFLYPTSSTLSNLNFHIKQYDSSGDLLNENYHDKSLDQMANTWNYTISLDASSTQALHYVVQLTDDGDMKRQYPFGIFVSDLDYTYSSDNYDYFFPRIVEMLRTKIIFNYYFAFHDGFYNMFNGNYSVPSSGDMDITFKTVSGDGEYNLDMKIFSASDSRVKSFTSGIRPYIVAILWLVFGVYVMFRITHLFSDNE